MVPTCATSALSVTGRAASLIASTTFAVAMSMPRLRSIGFMPAATAFMPSLDDGLGQNGGGGGAVAGFVIGAAGDFFHHLRAHVLELVLKLDFLGDGHTVLGDARGAEGFVEHHVAALGTQRDLDRVGEDVDALAACGCGRRYRI
jgi:hypothetical protein